MSITGVIAVVVFFWFILALIKPKRFAPFFKSGTRKKALLLFLAVSVVCGLLGGKPAGKNPQGGAGTKQEKVYKIGDTMKDKNFEITVLDKQTAKDVYDDSGYLKTTANGKYIVLHVKFKNIAKEAKRLNNGAFKIKQGDTTYSPVTLAVRTDKNIFLTALNPGVEKVGELYFDVPDSVADSNDLILTMSGFAFGSDNGDGKILLKK
ncbi:MAG: DUF4352 domain-containing protein [Acidaminococcus fermentans]|uniref:DUF4352 domain-containing protein n=1 Tax=Acidaminococcus fermentans TaxID=905 RepID=UPI00242C1AAF|nr:DUF4352 domain-containing protein [Acidaminococcus fermentans]MCI7194924.1 DUF4352 domain-containing protein [Acidaminococcus fermentans]